jgi:hypothetical protein
LAARPISSRSPKAPFFIQRAPASSLKARLLTSRGSLTTDPTAVPVYLHFEGSQQVPF